MSVINPYPEGKSATLSQSNSFIKLEKLLEENLCKFNDKQEEHLKESIELNKLIEKPRIIHDKLCISMYKVIKINDQRHAALVKSFNTLYLMTHGKKNILKNSKTD